MFRGLINKIRNHSYSLRFCILSIFVVFSIVLVIVLRSVTHALFMQSMTSLSFNLMENESNSAYQLIKEQMQRAANKTRVAAELLKSDIIQHKNYQNMLAYATSLLHTEQMDSDRVDAIYWGDETGNFIIAQKEKNNSITSEIIDRNDKPMFRTYIYHDLEGNVIGEKHSNDFSYDPRNRPWYIEAKKAKKTMWVGTYTFMPQGYLGISVASPVYTNNTFVGVFSLDVKLEYLQRLIAQMSDASHGDIFIVTYEGDLIAFPDIQQNGYKTLQNIHSLTKLPWIIDSFDHYKQTGETKFIYTYNKEPYLATYKPMFYANGHQWLIGVVVSEKEFVGELVRIHFISMAIAFSIFILGLIAMSALITRIIRPLKKITHEIEKIKHFELEKSKHIDSHIKEISAISYELDAMKQSLRSFQKYVPSALVRELIETGEDARIGGVKKSLAIMFCDIQDFTTIAEQIDPVPLTKQVCDYFDELSHIIVDHRGTIDKYIGDAIMAFWGAPSPVIEPSLHASIAALDCIQRSKELNKQWKSENKPEFISRIGIHLGEAIVGNLGSSERLNYTAIGDTINFSNRLVNVNKIYGTHIIVSESVYQAVNKWYVFRLLDCVILKGRKESNYIYELMAKDRGALTFDINKYNAVFAQAFTAYQNAQFSEAIKLFNQCLHIYPEDTVAPIFINRCEQLIASKPDKNWNGIWTISEK